MADDRSEDESAAEERTRLLKEILDRLGRNGERPNDPTKAARWDMPLAWQFGHLTDSLHTLRNHMQALVGQIELLGKKLDRNEITNQAILQTASKIEAVVTIVEASAERIAAEVGAVAHEKPLLMRDLFWLPTEPVEIGLILYAAIEAIPFFSGSDDLFRSAMFAAMASVSTNHIVWGMWCLVLALYLVSAFASRRRKLRLAGVFLSLIYFGATGGASLWNTPGVLGWVPHMLAALGAGWIILRGPSRAI